MSKVSDKTKLFIAVGLLEGLKTDLENINTSDVLNDFDENKNKMYNLISFVDKEVN